MKKTTAVVIGYGHRGAAYADYAVKFPEELEIVAVAEPVENKRETAMKRHHLDSKNMYTSWEGLAAQPKMADFAIIATMDKMHTEPALAMIEKGYHLLLEKPVAPTALECKQITEAAERKGVKIVVCHVLRFTDFWYTVKNLLDNDAIGDVRSVVHMENVGNLHYSHSFVRGNWRNSELSTPMILQKSCHDMDLLQWLLGKKCKKVQSFGSLDYFTHANRPEGAPDYCVQGCPVGDTCYYNAKKMYYEEPKSYAPGRAVVANTVDEPTDEQVLEAITHGPYGRCVFNCDNNVVDSQVVNLQFEDGTTANFSMCPFNIEGRHIRMYGTKGTLEGNMKACCVRVYSFATREWTQYDTAKIGDTIASGHGGGDVGIMRDMIAHINGDNSLKTICDIRTSCLSHLIAFAAEKSRLTGETVDLEQFEKEL